MSATTVIASARVEVLRRLAWWRQYRGGSDDYPRYVPLFGLDPWEHRDADVLLAVKECERMGEVRGVNLHLRAGMAEITATGLLRLRGIDARAASPARLAGDATGAA